MGVHGKLAKSPMEESANRLSRPGDRMSPKREGHEPGGREIIFVAQARKASPKREGHEPGGREIIFVAQARKSSPKRQSHGAEGQRENFSRPGDRNLAQARGHRMPMSDMK